MSLDRCSLPLAFWCKRAVSAGTALFARRSPSRMAALCGTTPRVVSSNLSLTAMSEISRFFSCLQRDHHRIDLAARRCARAKPVPPGRSPSRGPSAGTGPPVSAGIDCGSRNSARPSAAFWFSRKSCSSADVVMTAMSVGTARLSPMATRARSRRDARAVGARLDRQRLLDGLDQRIDGVGRLHVAEDARRDRRAIELVVGVVERRDHDRLRAVVLVAGEGLEVLGGAYRPGKAR